MPSKRRQSRMCRKRAALLLLAACLQDAVSIADDRSVIEADRFEKHVLVADAVDPMQMEVLPDGRVFFIERHGTVKVFHPGEKETVVVGRIHVGFFVEVGLLGMALANDFDGSGRIYLFFCPADKPDVLRLSEFTIGDSRLLNESERVVLEYPIDQKEAVHMGGGLWMTSENVLYVGTGDNTAPIPELPIDQRPGHEYLDAMRTSANSRDLRGKILRIRPEPGGSYSIPEGNLFPDGVDGRPEIYVMGCRNPFRLFVDERSGHLYWGDVGPNIAMEVPIGPNGYDEINRTDNCGNFGWPMFVGPNEAYRQYDFASGTLGAPFDPARPRNASRNNTGVSVLPPARPAILWYPSTISPEFPELGSGGRSAMASLVYYDRPDLDPQLKMPEIYDGQLFIHDWTRNWIKTVRFDAQGNVAEISPFMPGTLFRKPMQIKQGYDGSLYVMEFGDKWVNNRDAQIVRIVYRRGNRPPHPRIIAQPASGKEPLIVAVDGSDTADPDGNAELSYRWSINGVAIDSATSARFQHRFDQPGRYQIELSVADSQGLEASTVQTVSVGNAPPEVTLLEPPHGGFFDWGDVVKYRVRVSDLEDGRSDEHAIFESRIQVKASYATRRNRRASDAHLPPGLRLMKRTDLFFLSCYECGVRRPGAHASCPQILA